MSIGSNEVLKDVSPNVNRRGQNMFRNLSHLSFFRCEQLFVGYERQLNFHCVHTIRNCDSYSQQNGTKILLFK